MHRVGGLIFLAACVTLVRVAGSSTQRVAEPNETTKPATQPAAPSTQPIYPRDLWTDAAGGRLMIRSFDTAPYPHASRESGYKSSAGEFPLESHYMDSTVGIFIPPGFVAGDDVNYVVHFHGHRNNVANVLTKFDLPVQMAAANVNAILLVPQLPLNAPDSGGGKLELDDDGFKRFITEVTGYLKNQQVLRSDAVGNITLTAHSGGYKVTAAILHRGGLSDHITDVILLDASYGSLPWFAEFMSANPSARLVSFHTKHLDEENLELRTLLDARKLATRELDEATFDDGALAARGASFISTQLPHDGVPAASGFFRRCVTTAELPHR